jgi:hypothetical protein
LIYYTKTTRFFSAMLMVGGVFGLFATLAAGAQLAKQHWLFALPMLALAALFAWAAFAGLRLWQGTPYGRKWATILFASQVPILALPGFRYQWFTGAQFGPYLRWGDGSVTANFGANFGANGDFFMGSALVGSSVGVNLFAVIAFVMLLRANIHAARAEAISRQVLPHPDRPMMRESAPSAEGE